MFLLAKERDLPLGPAEESWYCIWSVSTPTCVQINSVVCWHILGSKSMQTMTENNLTLETICGVTFVGVCLRCQSSIIRHNFFILQTNGSALLFLIIKLCGGCTAPYIWQKSSDLLNNGNVSLNLPFRCLDLSIDRWWSSVTLFYFSHNYITVIFSYPQVIFSNTII